MDGNGRDTGTPGRRGPYRRWLAADTEEELTRLRVEIARETLQELAAEWSGQGWTTEALLAELVRRAGGEG